MSITVMTVVYATGRSYRSRSRTSRTTHGPSAAHITSMMAISSSPNSRTLAAPPCIHVSTECGLPAVPRLARRRKADPGAGLFARRDVALTTSGDSAEPGSLGHALIGGGNTTSHTSEEGDVRRASGVAAGVRGSQRAHNRAFRSGIQGWRGRHGFRSE